MDEAVLDAVDLLLSSLEDRDDVVFAEVGGTDRTRTHAVITHRGPRGGGAFSTPIVWCRVFADGAAGYRHCESTDPGVVEDTAERAVRAAKQQAHERETRYDPYSLHRGVHDGWAAASDRLSARDPEQLREGVAEAVADACAGRDLSRVRVELTADRIESSLTTTAGSAVRTSADRIGIDAAFDGETVRLRRHFGTTAGYALVDDLRNRLAAALDDLDRLESASPAAQGVEIGEGDVPVLLAPQAAAQLFLAVSRWLTADARYAGTAPLSVGDRIGPQSVTVHDTVQPGSWAARAYDAEAKPAQPVTLVDRGSVATLLHSTATAADDGVAPAGNVVAGLSAEHPPRISPRHLVVETGAATPDALVTDSALIVERFGEPWTPDQLLRKYRSSWSPPDPIASEATREQVADAVDPAALGRVDLPVAEGFALDSGSRAGRLDGATVEFDIGDLRSIRGICRHRETVTAVESKHKTRLPVAATAPAIALSTTVRRD
ncbi:metallopeptidase TldD-related protein [Haloferacaceae archaeon DSL9]